MNFTEAIEAMKQGKKVTHSRLTECGECNPLYIYIYYDKETSKYQFYGEVYEGDYLFNAVDVDATDWEIYKPEPALNPCGVCGDAHYAHSRIEGGTYVECSCGLRTSGVFGTLEEAARIWNAAHPIAETKKAVTNYEKVFLPWLNHNTASGICSFKEEFVISDCCCSDISCTECNKRFTAYLQEEYKEVKK